ncbi:peptidoglycan-binding protein [Cellulomonas fimi]|uniref:Peptidoglycan-binding protein n=1 Tax=Cellulomonas fimi TaxID=1708 RepID=A0A7Y0LYF5_CELFI|nr:peptidoglycan-binding protein [Cellulomonas fimi]NMR20395.1 peptidoglycan-binding protein [Cellulomonas fimi]
MTSRRPRARRALAVFGVLTLLAAACTGAGWWAQARTASPLTSDTPDGPLLVPVIAAERVARYGVGIAVTYADGALVTVNTGGTVTGVATGPGDVLAVGDEIVRVDDAPVLAFVADAPLWRDLAPGAEGEDVARLQRFLTDVGVYSGRADGKFGERTAEAVRRFNTAHGRKDAGTTFTLASVAWVGAAPFTVATVEAATGAILVPGSPVVQGPRQAATLTVTEPAGGIPAGVSYDLAVADTVTAYTPGSGTIADPAAIAAIAASLGTSGEGAGQVVTADPEPAVRVPASAVIVDETGISCVYDDPAGTPVPVTILGGTLAHADLAADLSIQQVLVNPMQVLEEPTCGSSPTP